MNDKTTNYFTVALLTVILFLSIAYFVWGQVVYPIWVSARVTGNLGEFYFNYTLVGVVIANFSYLVALVIYYLVSKLLRNTFGIRYSLTDFQKTLLADLTIGPNAQKEITFTIPKGLGKGVLGKPGSGKAYNPPAPEK